MTLEATGTYQIYCVRNGSYELDGCWGSEEATFNSLENAIEALRFLAKNYTDVGWAVAEPEGYVCHVTQPTDGAEDELEWLRRTRG